MNRANDALLLLGRLLMAALFLPSGVGKAMNFAPFAASLADKGLPYAARGRRLPSPPRCWGRSR
jgi:putative oxidoreductase